MTALITPRLFISGLSSDSYSENIGLALAHSLKKQGLGVSCCLIGSDMQMATVYSRIVNRHVRLLDPRLLSFDQILAEMHLSSLGADILLIISPYGFFDSSSPAEFSLTPAEIAIRSDTPTILTSNSTGFGSGVVPLLKGYKDFAAGLKLAGFINLNSIETETLGSYSNKEIEDILQKYLPTSISVTLELEEISRIKLPRGINHLKNETHVDRENFQKLIGYLENNINIDLLIETAKQATGVDIVGFDADPLLKRTRIAVADDVAFCLGYQNNLELLKYFGAELVTFSPVTDSSLPKNIGGIYLRGAVLKEYGQELSLRSEINTAIKEFISSGGAVYSEASSTAYLCNEFGNKNDWGVVEGVGAISANANHTEDSSYIGEATTIIDSVVGAPGLPVSFYNLNDWKLTNVDRMQNALSLYDYKGEKVLDGFSPNAQVFSSLCYLNFASNPQLALSFVDASEVKYSVDR